jgi:hypothetical protein
VNATVMLHEGHVRALKKAGKDWARPMELTAILDTGASHSALDLHIIQRLGLLQQGYGEIHTPSSEGQSESRRLFGGTLVLKDEAGGNPIHHACDFVEANLMSQGFHLLIGRDVLCRCRLVYIGRTERFRLSWK